MVLPQHWRRLRGLSLFSGIGAVDAGLAPWVRTVAYCEIDEAARSVLFSRMADGQISLGAIWDDVCTLDYGHFSEVPGYFDIITASFPCQDLSVAGTRSGLEGQRSGLYSHVVRIVGEAQPPYVFIENVPGLRKYLPRIRSDFGALGYTVRAGLLSAAAVGAPHRRDRIFLLAAHTDSPLLREQPRWSGGQGGTEAEALDSVPDQAQQAADADSKRQPQPQRSVASEWGRNLHHHHGNDWETTDDPVRLLDDGPAIGVVGQRLLGNCCPPAQYAAAFCALFGLPNHFGKELGTK